jgi:hypothetical protein
VMGASFPAANVMVEASKITVRKQSLMPPPSAFSPLLSPFVLYCPPR